MPLKNLSPKNSLFDVVIVGGGITGILNAHYLSQAGKKVALLEAEELGKGATSATTAFITQVIDTEPSKVAKLFGSKESHIISKIICSVNDSI